MSTTQSQAVAPEPAAADDDERVDPRLGRASSITLLVLGILGMLASATLTIERIELLINPKYTPSCSISPVLSCGSVMTTQQAAFFGFPNPLLGLPAFAIVIAAGLLAVGRVRLPTWWWTGLAATTFLGLIFIGYLITQSLYRINKLCPYCMVVWAVTPVIFALALKAAARSTRRPKLEALAHWVWPVLIVVYLAVLLLITQRFWDYWTSLL